MSNIRNEHAHTDPGIEAVATFLRQEDPRGERFAKAISYTYDLIYNGQATGRYQWSKLAKTEKTHFGTLFEINIQREFGFADGDRTDFVIAGHDVDAKWSQTGTAASWMLPPEVFGKIAMIATASDIKGVWSVGLVRAEDRFLRVHDLETYIEDGVEKVKPPKENRDRKTWLNPLGFKSVHWLWEDAPLPPNILLSLSGSAMERVMGMKHGSSRTNQLFREAEGQIVSRTAVATVSRQRDPQKRVRYNGGARSALAGEGFLILSGKYHRRLAEQLGVPIPGPHEYVSVAVVPSSGQQGAMLQGLRWRRAIESDVISESAPLLPGNGRSQS